MIPATSTVTIDQGPLEGFVDQGVLACLGIPYAQPPLGSLRFRSPRPHPGWEKPRSAVRFASRAVQTPLSPEARREDPGSEDCLYLNVWSPVGDGPHPVMFWVHGGAFVSGGADATDGFALAQAGMVVVSPNYRIGPFGYLYLADLAPGISDTNLALRDLALALDWTVRNITAFGGDPNRITLAGQSSGAMTVGSLITSPLVKGKFAAAWMMSGAALQVRSKKTATESAELFLASTGIPGAKASDLVEMPTETLIKASEALAQFSQTDDRLDAEIVVPVVGDDVLPVHPMSAIRLGQLTEISLIVTWTLDDMGLFRIFDPQSGGHNKELYARRLIGDQKWSELLRRYEETGSNPYVDLLTDFHFSIPARRLAEAQLDAGGNCWVGRFDRTPLTPPWPDYGPVHTCDLFYLFTPLSDPSGDLHTIGQGSGMLPQDRHLGERTRQLMLDLSSGRLPSSRPDWPCYSLQDRPTLLFDDPLRVANDPDGEHRRAWDGLLCDF